MPRQNKNSVTVSVTMPAEIRAETLRLAEKDERSFSKQVTLMLRKIILDNKDKEPNP